MYEFVYFNYIMCIFTSLTLAILILRYRYLVIKPSIVVIAFFNVQIQWAATAYSNEIYNFLPNPWIFALFAQGFPVIGLLVSMFTYNRLSIAIWKRIINISSDSKVDRKAITVLSIAICGICVYYLANIPFQNTGLYLMITDPSLATIARENSLKLITNRFLKYIYTFLKSTFAPIAAVLVMFSLIELIKSKKYISAIKNCFIIIIILIAVSFTGARSPAASVIFVIIVALYIKKGMPINIVKMLLALVIVLMFPVAFTILREGKIFSLDIFIQYLTSGIFDRVFVVPMETGLWHFHYAQTHGFIGIAGIPKLANLFRVTPINAANVVGLQYVNGAMDSFSANTSFVFSYYSYFGCASLIISLAGLWLLDSSLFVYKVLNENLLIPVIASITNSCMAFTSGDYTTVLISNGFIITLIVGKLIGGNTCRKGISTSIRSVEEI